MAFALPNPLPSSLLLLLLMMACSTSAQTYRNHSLGSSLTAQDDDSSWASPNGHFSFGFRRIENGGYLLAIWFSKIPELTIVWSANGDDLAPRGSKVELTTDGQFELKDPEGKKIWGADGALSGVAYAAMLDSGNLVLATQNSVNLWESFNLPTDTILPTNTIGPNGKLVARYSETNYSVGRFQFSVQADGNLVLQARDLAADSSYPVYWSSGTVGTASEVFFNESGSIYVKALNGSILKMISESNSESTQEFYQRAILEYDGVFRHYIYPKRPNISNSKSWPSAWTLLLPIIPSNICTAVMELIGSGACGFNSYCELGEDQRPQCKCPKGYDYIDPNDVWKGCKANFIQQSCNESSSEKDLFYLHPMLNTNWPQSDYEHTNGKTEDWCRNSCLGDCFCAAAIYGFGQCWKKKSPLSNGMVDSTIGGKALIKIRKDDSTFTPSYADCKKKDRSTLILIGSVLLSSSVFFNLLLLLVAFLAVFRFDYFKPKVVQRYPVMPGMNLRSFTYEELKNATDGFTEELGHGAFATVYKGALESNRGKLVAVKKLNNIVTQGDLEFKAEVSAIGRTNHKNLVQLLGFSNEGQHRLIVYEFMSRGSLANFLFGGSRPNWYQRIQIALGTARGLLYLHEECSTQIIHCDIKPQNILLDDSLTAKISDFGLAKLLKTDQTRTTTGIRGTKGYVAPEWFRNMPVTVKVDVYSFGILLLEIIYCRKSFEADIQNEDQMILTDWVYDCYKERKLDLSLGKDEEAMSDMKRVERYVMIAIWCIQEDPSLRPAMKKVIQMMEGAVEVPVPPDPSSFISSI
ncbi:hypothetical protein I3843_14G125200 [Carya illinoinensis]|nr:hypothetical protein I3760_14G128400 [Carya illinoinensis]KAG7948022.1 hypothetical protein I3843_14G125200 [Carya illinoinensis]